MRPRTKKFELLTALIYDTHDYIDRYDGYVVAESTWLMNRARIFHKKTLIEHLEELEIDGYIKGFKNRRSYLTIELTQPTAFAEQQKLMKSL